MTVSQTDCVRDPLGVQRRKFCAELATFEQEIQACHLHDALTSDIADYHRKFSKALESPCEVGDLQKQFNLLLKSLLHDRMPTHRFPLDEEAYYSSDRQWVGGKALAIYLYSQDPKRRGLSPFSVTTTAPFTVQPHPLARFVVRYLKAQGDPIESSAPVEQVYARLKQQGALPTIPLADFALLPQPLVADSFKERIEKLRARSTQKKTQSNCIKERMEPIRASIERLNQAHAERLHKRQELHIQQWEAIREEACAFRQEIKALKQRNQQLQAQLDQIDSTLNETERATAHLEMAINTTKQAIAERKAKESEGFARSILTVAGCVIASFAIQQLLVLPVQGGGASLNWLSTF